MTLRLPARLGIALAALALAACSSPRTPDQVDFLLAQALHAAASRHDGDMDAEAAILVQAIAAVDPDYPGLGGLNQDLDPHVKAQMTRGVLGANRQLRPSVDRPLALRALLYLPDRVLDLLDVVTAGVHLGPGAFGDVHVTRGLQLSAGMRSVGGVGLHERRSVGLKSQTEAGFSVLMAGAQSYGSAVVGSSGLYSAAGQWAGVSQPSEPVYQSVRDYWAVGGSATALLFGFEVDFHPVQLVDFLAGFVLIDFANDDFAHTRSLDLDAVENQLLTQIWGVRKSKGTLVAYRAAVRTGTLRMREEQAPAAPAR